MIKVFEDRRSTTGTPALTVIALANDILTFRIGCIDEFRNLIRIGKE